VNFADLKNTLKEGIASAYVIYGSDNFLVQKSVDMITETAGVADKLLNVSRLDNESNPAAIIAACRTVSFFGGKRVVTVKPFAPEQMTQEMKKYLDAPDPDCVLILVLAADKNTISGAAAKKLAEVNCNPMSANIVTKLIANQLAAAGKKISYEAADLLARYCGNIYARVDNEITKLCNYFDNLPLIDAPQVAQICSKTEDYQTYELAQAICAGKVSESDKILSALQAAGVDEYLIFANLVSAFRRIFYSLTCKSDTQTMAAFLGCSPYAVQYARRDNKHLTEKIAALYNYILELEYQIKSGKISVENALVLCYELV